MQAELQGEACTNLPAFHTALCSCHLSQHLYRSSWSSISANRTETFPSNGDAQLHLHQHLHWPITLVPLQPCGLTKQGPEVRTSLCHLPSDTESTLSLSTKDWRLHFPGYGAELSSWSRAFPKGCLIPQLSQGCLTAVLYHNWAVCTEQSSLLHHTPNGIKLELRTIGWHSKKMLQNSG